MFSLRVIAGVTAVVLAATPALVRAASACHCNDHLRHVAVEKKASKSSCCHKGTKRSVDKPCDRLQSHRCCSEQLVALERDLATIDKRPVLEPLLISPELCQLMLLAPQVQTAVNLSARSSRAPPGVAAFLRHCVFLI